MSVSHEYSGPCCSHVLYIFAIFSRQQNGSKIRAVQNKGSLNMKSKDCSYRTNENRIIEGFEKSNESNLTKLSGKKDRETTMVLSERDQRFPMPRVLRIYFFPFCFSFSISLFFYFSFFFFVPLSSCIQDLIDQFSCETRHYVSVAHLQLTMLRIHLKTLLTIHFVFCFSVVVKVIIENSINIKQKSIKNHAGVQRQILKQVIGKRTIDYDINIIQ